MKTKELFAWIKARHSIYEKRLLGKPKPWTSDEILQQYRFCNVYRELDTVTQWIAVNWRAKYKADPDLWFAMVVARLVNWPDTLELLEPAVFKNGKVTWNPVLFNKVMAARKTKEEKVFSGAYIVSTNGHEMDKAEYLAAHVLTPAWEDRRMVRPGAGMTLQDFHKRMMNCNGMGSFMAAQVVADMKYVEPLLSAADWLAWAASGPGSRRGLNRVMDVDLKTGRTEKDWLTTLQKLHLEINKLIKSSKMPELHAQDLQNCLCEFDKYERVRLGEGKPRSKYPGV